MNGTALESVLGTLEDGPSTERRSTGDSTAWNPTDRGLQPSGTETALVVSCSLCGCGHVEGLWPVEPSWRVVDISTLGNRAWTRHDGETVLDETLTQRRREYDVTAVLVVGHTACRVVADAHDRHVEPATGATNSVRTRSVPLLSLVADAFDAGVVDRSTSLRTARYRLVEYNVLRQVTFLRETLPDPIRVVGYVHDEDGAYSSFPGKRYLVALDGESGPPPRSERPRDDGAIRVASLLS